MVLFNKQGKWFPPHHPQTPKFCPAKDRDIPEFSGSRINLPVPKDMRLFNREGSTEIWTVSELTKHASHSLRFAGRAKPLAVHWTAPEQSTVIDVFSKAASTPMDKFTESSACCLDYHKETSNTWMELLPNSVCTPKCDRTISHSNRFKATNDMWYT